MPQSPSDPDRSSEPTDSAANAAVQISPEPDDQRAGFEARRAEVEAAYFNEFSELSEEAATAAHYFFGYPAVIVNCLEHDDEVARRWQGWRWDFGPDAFARMDGIDFVNHGLLFHKGRDAREVVAGIEHAIQWLADRGHMSPADKRRLLVEISDPCQALIQEAAGCAADDVRYQGCRPEEVVAPFVAWLRETMQLSLNQLLCGQALAIAALEQLDHGSLFDAPWEHLDLSACMATTEGRVWMLDGSASGPEKLAGALVNFLYEQGCIGRGQRARMLIGMGRTARKRGRRRKGR